MNLRNIGAGKTRMYLYRVIKNLKDICCIITYENHSKIDTMNPDLLVYLNISSNI